MKHLMVDLETMGDSAGDSIVSIGAVQFDIETGELGKEFYQEVKLSSCLNAGLTVKASTIMWWMQQNEEARQKIINAEANGLHIDQAIYSFRWFLKQFKIEEMQIWGNSNRFDMGILAAAHQKTMPGVELPWKFYNERDVRTLVGLKPQFKANATFEGIPHDPISDCKHQIKYLVETYNAINKPILIEKEIIITQQFTQMPETLGKHAFPHHPGVDGASFYIPLEKPFKNNDCISPIPNSKDYVLYVTMEHEFGNTVRLTSDNKSHYFPTKYLQPKQKFYKL